MLLVCSLSPCITLQSLFTALSLLFPAASIKDIYHERAWLETSISQVRVRVVVEVSSRDQGIDLLRALRESGYKVDSLSSNYSKYDTAASEHDGLLH